MMTTCHPVEVNEIDANFRGAVEERGDCDTGCGRDRLFARIGGRRAPKRGENQEGRNENQPQAHGAMLSDRSRLKIQDQLFGFKIPYFDNFEPLTPVLQPPQTNHAASFYLDFTGASALFFLRVLTNRRSGPPIARLYVDSTFEPLIRRLRSRTFRLPVWRFLINLFIPGEDAGSSTKREETFFMRKTNNLKTRLVIFLVAGLVVALPALAQIPTGTVTGKVETADGTTRLPGVVVTATSPALQGERRHHNRRRRHLQARIPAARHLRDQLRAQ